MSVYSWQQTLRDRCPAIRVQEDGTSRMEIVYQTAIHEGEVSPFRPGRKLSETALRVYTEPELLRPIQIHSVPEALISPVGAVEAFRVAQEREALPPPFYRICDRRAATDERRWIDVAPRGLLSALLLGVGTYPIGIRPTCSIRAEGDATLK